MTFEQLAERAGGIDKLQELVRCTNCGRLKMSKKNIIDCLEMIDESWGNLPDDEIWARFLDIRNYYTIDTDYYDDDDCEGHPSDIVPFY
jgi:hypothetical protein